MSDEEQASFDRFRLAEVGCPEVDRQHQQIESAIAKLIDTILRTAPQAEVMGEFHRLTDMIRDHFTDEENIFAAAKVDLLDRHRKEHQRLLGALHGVGERLADGGTETPIRIMLEVADQIAQHVYSYDMTYRTAKASEKV